MTNLRVVLAEDAPLLRTGIVTVLESDGHQVCAAVGSADELREATRVHQPDVVVTDVRMPPTHTDEGIRVAIELRRATPGLPVVILSQYTTVGSLEQLLDRDADTGRGGLGYLLKDRVAHVRHFLDAVREIASGATIIDPDIVVALVGASRRRGVLGALTPREEEVLGLMAQGLTNPQIADRLVVSEAAVRKHVGNIFAKLPIPQQGDRRVLAVLTYLNES
ncbi:response regulator transcription factor [Mycolicibacterium parafortuitum]|uniref:Two-component system response regulator [Amycolatopsis mediterranei S699] n=1 Tax=Mycolicibacterium parafortuitum TaxID=39692 RepID=A0A375YD98_MYCPF|nr:response regulator transcription factor [Mycolicibacterium parafortuitum]ORB31064.1 DNA-binding response regulator [Mycolicibacterium parafortuitum]SRX79093.1 two-component system response regulator [Amycolatopsis mediterranei S699] [Mycolicibacterium parafortuitum]